MSQEFWILKGNIIEMSTVGLAAPAITSPNTATGSSGCSFSYQITATNSPVTFSADNLPYNLSLDGVTGAITGTVYLVSSGVQEIVLHAANDVGVGDMILRLFVDDNC